MDIDLILAKIGGLKDLLRNQFEAKILWSSVAALKHSKSKYKKQSVTDNFQITPNCYTLLGNDSNTYFSPNSLTTRMQSIQYDNRNLRNAPMIKFLGLMFDSNLTWNQRVDLILRRLSSACYAINCVKYTLPIDILKLIYFANIKTIMSYGIIFLGASTTASQVFLLQKKILRIIYRIKPRESCRKLFCENRIMTFYSLYLYSLALFVANNKDLFDTNNIFHQYNTRTNRNLHLPSIHLTKYAKSPYVNGIKVFNHLPENIKNLECSPTKFKKV